MTDQSGHIPQGMLMPIDPAEWRVVQRLSSASEKGEIQLRVTFHESRHGLSKLLGLAELWARNPLSDGQVDYERAASYRFEYDFSRLVDRLVQGRCGDHLGGE